MGAELERVPTGIPGLDGLIEGGLVEGSVYIVDGSPGAGKTLLAAQMCFASAARGERAIFMTLLAESHDRLARHLSRMDFWDPKAIPEQVVLLGGFKTLESDGLDALLALTLREVLARQARLLVVDGFRSAEEIAADGIKLRKFIQGLQALASSSRCIILLLNSTEQGEHTRASRPERTMVDGIIELSDELIGFRPSRHIRVAKMRGTDPVRGVHTLAISDAGLAVHQRFETRTAKQFPAQERANAVRKEQSAFGIPQLDRMLGGGVADHSVTMLLGPTGSGKTILGLQFLAEGARAREPGLYFGFYEQPDDLARKAARVGIDIDRDQKSGMSTLEWNRSAEASIDILGERLMQSVERTRATRVFLDGMQAFQRAIGAPERIGDVMGTMIEEFHRRGIVMVYSVETPQLLGPDIAIPLESASQITNNIIVLRHLQVGARAHRLISVLKVRDSAFDSSQREFEITDTGFAVAEDSTGADRLLRGEHGRPPR